MRIILLFPKWTQEYGILSTIANRISGWPPLNLAYLAAIAENIGHTVKIIDGECENLPLEKMVDSTKAFEPDIIAITATSPFYHVAIELAHKLKKEIDNCPIVIGGAHITVFKDDAFDPCFDYAFIGEADQSWALFLEQYSNEKDFSKVKGILYRDGDNIMFTGDADPIIDLDSIPVPARHLLKNDIYTIGTLDGDKPFTTVMSVRGCPFKCIFCSTKVFGHMFRKRSPRLVVDEIKSVIKNYNIKHFQFIDETFTLDKKHVFALCDLIEEENLGITFEASTRANLVDEEIISRMAKAGMIRISFGLESVDENIRRIMRKEIPLESYITANKLTNKYGLETLNSCMIGLPGETFSTIKKTLSFLRDSHEIKMSNISIAVPYPGTELYEMAKKGDYGLKLETDDFSQFRRYNSAVMSVGDLSPEELIKLQNDAIASIYLAPWRWIPMLKKSGFFGFLLTFSRVIKSVLRGRYGLLFVDRNYWKQKDGHN